MKICEKCGKKLPIKFFYKHATTHDGLDTYCKFCKKEKDRKLREEYRKINEIRSQTNSWEIDSKFCSKCKKIKKRSEFHKNFTRKNGMATFCIECVRLEENKKMKKNETHISVNKICEKLNESREEVIEFLKTLNLNAVRIPFGNQAAVYYKEEEIMPHIEQRVAEKINLENENNKLVVDENATSSIAIELKKINSKIDAIMRDLGIKEGAIK